MSHSAEKCKRGDPLGTLKKIRKKISQKSKGGGEIEMRKKSKGGVRNFSPVRACM